MIDAKIKRVFFGGGSFFLSFFFFFFLKAHASSGLNLLAMQAHLIQDLFRSCKIILTFWSNYVLYTCTFDEKKNLQNLYFLSLVLFYSIILSLKLHLYNFDSTFHQCTFCIHRSGLETTQHPSPWWLPILQTNIYIMNDYSIAISLRKEIDGWASINSCGLWWTLQQG